MLTLQIKLIIAALLAVALGYSYYWTYHQGQLTGRAAQVAANQVATEKLVKQLNDQRTQDLKDARAMFEQQVKNEQKKAAYLNKANDILKQQLDAKVTLADPVPDAFIELLNAGRINFGDEAVSDSGKHPT